MARGSTNAWRDVRLLKLYGVMGTLLVLLWGGIFLDVERARGELLSRKHDGLKNLALAFAMQIESSVKTIDVTLIDLRDQWEGDGERFAKAVRQRQEYLKRELAFQVAVIDASGTLAFSSLEQPAKPLDLSDREHFKVHRQRSVDELFISKPLLGRVSNRWSIQFTRPIYDSHGTFSGVVVLSVSPEYFSRFYRSIQLSGDSIISVVRQEGEILSRYPNPESALGKRLTDVPYLSALSPDSGVFERQSQVDGFNRMYAWRKIESYNLVVVVGHAVWEMMRPYQDQRSRAMLAGVGISALLLLVGYLSFRSNKQRLAEEVLLAENEERWRLALEAAGDGVWDWDMAHNRVLFSRGWKTMLGYSEAEIGSELDEWKKRVHPDDMSSVLDDLERHFAGEATFYTNEHRVLSKDGSWKWILDRGMVIERDADGRPLRMVGTHTDISARKQMEDMLTKLATTDGLTGLDNRRCFLEKLDSEMVRVKRYAHSQASVLMADIDFFKRVNDTHGHAAGDAALLHVAKLLRGAVRQSDTVGRLGGEEFAVLLPETSMGNAEQFAQRVCAMLRETPVQVGEIVIPLTISIGVTTIAEVDQGPEQILNRADLALYEAKRRGRDRVVSNHDAVQPSSNTADFSI